MTAVTKLLSRMRARMSALVETVPKSIELCEFDCERTRCNSDEVQACERRQHFVASRDSEVPNPATQMSDHQ